MAKYGHNDHFGQKNRESEKGKSAYPAGEQALAVVVVKCRYAFDTHRRNIFTNIVRLV